MRPLLAASLVLAVGCTAPAPPADPPGPPVCRVRFAAPPGFEPLERFEQPYRDHVGIRLGFRDAERRELHVFAGIPGEFGEGLPAAGTLELAGGATASLYGSGEVWVLIWGSGEPCTPRAVLGTGFSRTGFTDALRAAGVVAGG